MAAGVSSISMARRYGRCQDLVQIGRVELERADQVLDELVDLHQAHRGAGRRCRRSARGRGWRSRSSMPFSSFARSPLNIPYIDLVGRSTRP